MHDRYGKTLRENVGLRDYKITNVIRPIDNPHTERGGLAVLFGNLAPNGAIIKAVRLTNPLAATTKVLQSASILKMNALAGIANGKVKEGHVVVIRYEGPKGGPGMPEMLAPTSQIVGMGLGAKVALNYRWTLLRRIPRHLHRPRFSGSC